jgi:hypothetical protein
MKPLRPSWWTLALLAAVCAAVLPAAAQGARDPTLPPWGSGSGGGGGGGAAQVRGLQGPFSVLVVDGQPYLVVGTRLYAQGQQLGAARIERITETEVWLRDGHNLRKISNFVGIQRRGVTTTVEAPACGASAARPATESQSSSSLEPVAACDSAKP